MKVKKFRAGGKNVRTNQIKIKKRGNTNAKRKYREQGARWAV
jgi:hypothetical protein